MNGGLRVRQNLLEPECLVSMDNQVKASAASSSAARILTSPAMYNMAARNAFEDVSIKSPVGCLRRDTGVLGGRGLSLMNMNSRQGIENCYYEHFILDYRVPHHTTSLSNNGALGGLGGGGGNVGNGPAPGTERITIDSVMSSMKPRKTKFPALAFFSCEDCGRCYRSKTSLGLHKRLECGKEPTFQCPYCPLKTHQKGNLNVHIKKKHTNVPHLPHMDGDQSDGGEHPSYLQSQDSSQDLVVAEENPPIISQDSLTNSSI
ncbi:longitudinals lacking protein-like [Nilaparvata lugens]|uniref:longitudinals lacking protein-like n=1 Tax=Nilaparvata lugens TaxID=108931 RepID=UPI00193E75BB|nr:longitudinals lacking protein-like [Nilaparvata lugens]